MSKIQQLLSLRPRILRKDAAAEYVGGIGNLNELLAAKWVRPLKAVSRNTSYDVKDLDGAIDRAQLDGWPHRNKEAGK